jgi:hypothetical protein
MPDVRTKFDMWLDRVSKIAGILLPVVVAAVGFVFTANKDKSDRLAREAQQRRDEYQRNWDKTQKQYANMTALVPLLTSRDLEVLKTGLEIYESEANADQAPLDLRATTQRIKNLHPELQDAAGDALDAVKIQMGSTCRWDPDGLYIQVANSKEQWTNGKHLKELLTNSGKVVVQGVQRIDASPPNTELRYFFTEANNAQAARIKAELSNNGFKIVKDVDLTKKYLKGCSAPGTFELWIGSAAPLAPNGTGTG